LRPGQPQYSCRRAAAACCWLALNAWHGEKNGRGCHRRAQSVPAERRVGASASKTTGAARGSRGKKARWRDGEMARWRRRRRRPRRPPPPPHRFELTTRAERERNANERATTSDRERYDGEAPAHIPVLLCLYACMPVCCYWCPRAERPPHLGCTPPIFRPYPTHISRAPRPYLAHIPPVSRPHLAYP